MVCKEYMKRVDDFRLRFGKKELVPIVIGGMGVDISTAELALEAARLGGIGTISDAMILEVSDMLYGTHYNPAKSTSSIAICFAAWTSRPFNSILTGLKKRRANRCAA